MIEQELREENKVALTAYEKAKSEGAEVEKPPEKKNNRQRFHILEKHTRSCGIIPLAFLSFQTN